VCVFFSRKGCLAKYSAWLFLAKQYASLTFMHGGFNSVEIIYSLPPALVFMVATTTLVDKEKNKTIYS